MDNLENTSGAGEADVTSSSAEPQGTETQPESLDQSVDGGNQAEAGDATSYPWQAEEKFKNAKPEDIFKSYKEMEKLYSRKAEVANLIEEKFGVTPEQLKQVIAEQENARQEQELAQNPAGYALREVQTLKQQLALQSEEKELDGFLAKSPEYAPFRDKILTLGLNLERDKSYEEIAHEYFGQARAQGQEDAYKKIDTKVKTQATGVRSVPQRTITPEDMKKMSVAELEAILPHADTSNRLY